MNERRAHWDSVYATKAETDVSWYQPKPAESLRLIGEFAPDRSTAIIDIGCGASTLIGELAKQGYSDLTALDASEIAIAKARRSFGRVADRVGWIVADVTRWKPKRQWRLWHDRGTFHFLTGKEEQEAYVRAMRAALSPASTAIFAAYAPDGPETCSGLPVERYSATRLATRLGENFRLIKDLSERHLTPRGAVQSFVYAVFEVA